jgi:hypothetical protein
MVTQKAGPNLAKEAESKEQRAREREREQDRSKEIACSVSRPASFALRSLVSRVLFPRRLGFLFTRDDHDVGPRMLIWGAGSAVHISSRQQPGPFPLDWNWSRAIRYQ